MHQPIVVNCTKPHTLPIPFAFIPTPAQLSIYWGGLKRVVSAPTSFLFPIQHSCQFSHNSHSSQQKKNFFYRKYLSTVPNKASENLFILLWWSEWKLAHGTNIVFIWCTTPSQNFLWTRKKFERRSISRNINFENQDTHAFHSVRYKIYMQLFWSPSVAIWSIRTIICFVLHEDSISSKLQHIFETTSIIMRRE